MQNVSNNFPINHEVPTIDKIQKNLCQLKSGKASNNVDLELLKKNVNTHLCYNVFVEWQIAYGQTSIFLPFRVIIDLKLSGKEKDQLQMLISIKDLGSEQQCESRSLISSWNELDHGIRHKQISNRKKTTFISVIC